MTSWTNSIRTSIIEGALTLCSGHVTHARFGLAAKEKRSFPAAAMTAEERIVSSSSSLHSISMSVVTPTIAALISGAPRSSSNMRSRCIDEAALQLLIRDVRRGLGLRGRVGVGLALKRVVFE